MKARMMNLGRGRLSRTAPAILAVLAVLLLPACERRGGGAGQGQEEREVGVRTVAVVDTSIARPVRATGALTSKEETPLSFKVGGVIARIEVEEGQAVPAGRLLAVLETAEIDALVAKAQAGAEKAERDLQRARALYADSVVTQEVMENVQTAAEVAAKDLEIALYNRGRAAIHAPEAGIVLRRLAEPGQMVAPGTPVLFFGAASKGEVVRVGLPDREVVRVSLGDPAEVSFDAFPGMSWSGKVTRLGAAAAPGAGTYEAEILLDRPVPGEPGGADLSSGLVGDAVIHPAKAQAVRLVPVLSLLEGEGDRAVVWSLDGSLHPRKHEVRVAFLEGGRAAIGRGLEGVDRVVADGAAYLTETSRVRLDDGR